MNLMCNQYSCVMCYPLSLHRESPNLILGDEPIISEVVLSQPTRPCNISIPASPVGPPLPWPDCSTPTRHWPLLAPPPVCMPGRPSVWPPRGPPTPPRCALSVRWPSLSAPISVRAPSLSGPHMDPRLLPSACPSLSPAHLLQGPSDLICVVACGGGLYTVHVVVACIPQYKLIHMLF
jgi:hypothetical protein